MGRGVLWESKNTGQLDPPRMLGSKCINHCGLKAMYLVAGHSDASLYSLTNSPEWLHGGLWYFQLPQSFTFANSMNVTPIAIQNGMPAQKSRDTTVGRIHQMVKISVPVLTNVYLLLLVAVYPLPQSPIHLNQWPSHLLMVLVGSNSQVIQWLDLFWIFILLPLPEGMACEELAHPNTLQHDLWQWLWRHSDCYDLQKVQMMLKGRVLIVHLSTKKHRDETLVARFSIHNFNIWSTKCNGSYILYALPLSSITTCHGSLLTVFIPYSTSVCILERGWHILWFAQTSCDWMG